MRELCLFLLISSCTFAQAPASAPAAATPPETVVAKIDGQPYTVAQIRKLLEDCPPQIRASFDKRPEDTLTTIFLVKYLADQALLHHLDDNPQFKEGQSWLDLQTLSQAQLSYVHDSYRPPDADQRAYYDKYPEKWQRAKFREIVIQFKPNQYSPIKRTEEEAKALAEDLRKQIVSGADFSAVAKAHSDDKFSGEKGGEHPPLERTGAYPETLKKLLFTMKPGEVSEPVRQIASYYIVKLEEIATLPYNEVESRIFRELQQEHFTAYVKSVDEANRITVVNPAFFATPGAH